LALQDEVAHGAWGWGAMSPDDDLLRACGEGRRLGGVSHACVRCRDDGGELWGRGAGVGAGWRLREDEGRGGLQARWDWPSVLSCGRELPASDRVEGCVVEGLSRGLGDRNLADFTALVDGHDQDGDALAACRELFQWIRRVHLGQDFRGGD